MVAYVGSGRRAQQRRLEGHWASIQAGYGLLTDREARVIARTESLPGTGLLAMVRNGEAWYPGFQFTGDSVRAEWRELTEPLLQAGWHPEDVLLWFAAPTGWLDGRVPADLLDDDVDAVRVAVTSVASDLGC